MTPRLRRSDALRISAAALGILWTAWLGGAAPGAPPFSLRQEGGSWWLVAPDGKRFFSRGVCVVTPGTGREEFDFENPSYAAWQHYTDTPAWASATVRRLQSWGFTTVGAWSDFESLRSAATNSLWLTPVLHMGSTVGAPWWDMWDEKLVARMDRVARDQILAVRDDPRLLG